MNKEMKSENGTALERTTLLENGEKENKTQRKSKVKIALAIAIPVVVIAIVLVGFIFANNSLNLFKQNLGFGGENIDERAAVIGGEAKITSAEIIDTATGTGPWDENDDPGNDSSEDNDVVRSFDQVTWTVDLTMGLKDTSTAGALTGGIIEVEATLPDTCENVMAWDLDSMLWMEDASVSADGTTVTGKYSMSDTETTVPGKQTLVFVLKVEGAGNGTEIVPTFNFKLTGNDEADKVSLTGDTIKVSAKGKYNIQLHRNDELGTKTTVDYGEGKKSGRMYGYTFAVQLYNENSSKGLKGIEYPKDEISFDIDLKLERSMFASEELEDITTESTPVLWQYGVNDWSAVNGQIGEREYFRAASYYSYDNDLPLGKFVDPDFSVYNSGNIKIIQDENKLKVTINEYGVNGIFPLYNSSYSTATTEKNRKKIYTENIGTFSVGFMQIFIPDTDATTIGDRNYYLTVSDSNMQINSKTGEIINTQMLNTDDSIRVQHVLYKPGSYTHALYVFDKNATRGSIESSHGTGDGRASLGMTIKVYAKFQNNLNNDNDVYTANKFIKFDGNGYE